MQEDLCPECGTARIGALRYCLKCGLDFDDRTGGTAADPAIVQPGRPPGPPLGRSSRGLRTSRPVRAGLLVALVGLLALVVVATVRPGGLRPSAGSVPATPTVSPTAPGSSEPAAPSGSAAASESAAPSGSVAPGETLAAAPTHRPGESVTVAADGVPYVEVYVDRVRTSDRYTGPTFEDRPRTPGNVFIQARVTYRGLRDGAVFNRFDWRLLVDGVAVQAFTAVTEGPKPELGSGALAAGETAQGWIVYEVPPRGQILLSYTGSFRTGDPLFAYVLRST